MLKIFKHLKYNKYLITCSKKYKILKSSLKITYFLYTYLYIISILKSIKIIKSYNRLKISSESSQ